MPVEYKTIHLKTRKAWAFAPRYRKRFLSWVDSARQLATKEARIRQTVLMAAANKKPGAKGFKL